MLWVVRHPKTTLGIAGAVLAAAVACSLLFLSISTDTDKLVDPELPFFQKYMRFDEKFPENDAAYILVRTASQRMIRAMRMRRITHTMWDVQQSKVDDWVTIADRIADRLRHLPTAVEKVEEKFPRSN